MNPHRKALLAKVHIARQQLGLDDDTYRALLQRVTGRRTAALCEHEELVRMVEEFERRGFVSDSKGRSHKPLVRKAYALWTQLHEIGAVGRPPASRAKVRQGLRTFTCNRYGTGAPEWCTPEQLISLVEALKSWLARVRREKAGT